MGKAKAVAVKTNGQDEGAAAGRPAPAGLYGYGLLIGATVLLVIAALLSWQIALVVDESRELEQLQHARQVEITYLGKYVAELRVRAGQAVDASAVVGAFDSLESATAGDDSGGGAASRPPPETPLPDAMREAAAKGLKAALPDLVGADFYRSDIGDVLDKDLGKFGYARSAVLVQAVRLHAMAPVQSVMSEGHRLLAIAAPVVRGGKTLAYAYLTLPVEPLFERFHSIDVDAGRIELRQDNGLGNFMIAVIGKISGNMPIDEPAPIAGSTFRLDVIPRDLPIFLPHRPWLLAALLALALLGAALALYVRRFGSQAIFGGGQRADDAPAPTLAQLVQTQAEHAAQAPPPPPAKALAAPVPAAATLEVDRSIFRAYDIRGVLGKTLDAGVARLIGRAIGSEGVSRGLTGIAVGRDGRLSGPELSAALIEGLRSAGMDVTDIGAAPTPLLYFATHHLRLGCGVSVTGSHNPPDYNGFKIVLGGETLAEEAIQKLYERIAANDFTSGQGMLAVHDLAHDYIERIAGDVQMQRTLRVVVDCGSGIAGAVAPDVLSAVGAEVVPLYCEVDGHFPYHHPDPSDPHNLQDLILTVQRVGADLGLAFDGDGDRLGVVTASGEVIYPDRVLMLFARDVLSRNPGATVLYDVKCTGKLQPLIFEAGGVPLMWRTGHSLIKAKMRQTEAALAGEMSGHFFFGERWYGFDDGIYAAARLLEILTGDPDGRAPQAIFDDLPKGVSTPELKIAMAEGEHYRFMERFKDAAKFDGARLTTIDGIRADWPDGWGLVRPSNTTPVLVLRFDADDAAVLRRIQTAFREQLLALDPKLKLPF